MNFHLIFPVHLLCFPFLSLYSSILVLKHPNSKKQQPSLLGHVKLELNNTKCLTPHLHKHLLNVALYDAGSGLTQWQGKGYHHHPGVSLHGCC